MNEYRNYHTNILIKNFEKSSALDSRDLNLYLDSTIAPSALNEDFYNEINCLAPFGPGNNEPKFVIENLKTIENLLKTIVNL